MLPTVVPRTHDTYESQYNGPDSRYRVVAEYVTGDGVVDLFDAVAIGQRWGTSGDGTQTRVGPDRNGDGIVDICDAALVGQTWGTTANETS